MANLLVVLFFLFLQLYEIQFDADEKVRDGELKVNSIIPFNKCFAMDPD